MGIPKRNAWRRIGLTVHKVRQSSSTNVDQRILSTPHVKLHPDSWSKNDSPSDQEVAFSHNWNECIHVCFSRTRWSTVVDADCIIRQGNVYCFLQHCLSFSTLSRIGIPIRLRVFHKTTLQWLTVIGARQSLCTWDLFCPLEWISRCRYN